MKTTIDRNYGADADGNRGITVYEYEIEESDRPEIEKQVAKILANYDADDQPKTVEVILDGLIFEVDVCDYK